MSETTVARSATSRSVEALFTTAAVGSRLIDTSRRRRVTLTGSITSTFINV